MKGIIVAVGPSGTGKSTWAHKVWSDDPKSYSIVNRDKIRELLFGYTEKTVKDYYEREDLHKLEKEVTRIEDTMITEALSKNKTVIVDSTNLRKTYLERFKYWNVPVNLNFFDGKLSELYDRTVSRGREIPKKVIKKQLAMYRNLLKQYKEGMIDLNTVEFENDKRKKPCIIFDIDGTLAHKKDRSPYDWSKVLNDQIDYSTALISDLISENKYIDIVICTGRDGSCIEDTKLWLDQRGINYNAIYIRKPGSFEPDWIVKERMWRQIAKTHYIVGMFDDRQQVVRRARALGLKVFNVEYNNF